MKPTPEENRLRLRTILVGAMFCAMLAGICAKAAYLQTLQRSWLSEKAAHQVTASMDRKGKRGTIFDANLREMAVSVDRQRDGVGVECVLGQGSSIEIGEHLEAKRVTTDDCNAHRKTMPSGSDHRGWCPTDTKPDRERLLLRSGIDRLTFDRRTESARPVHLDVVADLQQ